MEKGPLISDFPMKTSILTGFSIAMFDYQRVFRFRLLLLRFDLAKAVAFFLVAVERCVLHREMCTKQRPQCTEENLATP